ncbi:MAG: substrate-binding domain-containing protein [bacterium]
MNHDRIIRVFSARACAEPLREAAVLFEQNTGTHVEISVCNRHCASPVAEEAVEGGGHADFLVEIAEEGIHDLAIAGAEYLLDDGEVRGIVKKGERRTIACRESAIVVPAGNPAGITTLKDMARPGVKVAISVMDCLKGLWEDLSGRAGLIEPIRRNITFKANGCVAIVEAVVEGKIDCAFGWSSFAHLAPGRIEVVKLPPAYCIYRGTCIGLLKFSKNPAEAVKFMDFLTTAESKQCYRKYGWVI